MMPLKPNVYIDVSSLLHWAGPAVGMMRVEHEVAVRHALAGNDVDLCYYDVKAQAYRPLLPRYAGQLIGWSARLEPPRQIHEGWRRLLPDRARALMLLERLRLSTPSMRVAKIADRLQRFMLSLRAHRFPIDDERGRRIDIIPFDLALGKALELGPGDVVLTIASDWARKDAKAIIDLKRRSGFRLAVLCYDVIPLLFPHFFPVEDVIQFRLYWEQIFGSADLVIVNARCTERDIKDYCNGAGIRVPSMVSIPLGCDPFVAQGQERQLRSDLEPQRYALYVSTIEPRKNHALLMRVWKHLLADGVVGSHNFKLVFVGRRGWLTDGLQAEIDAGTGFAGTLLHIENADDEELSSLYANAAFCLYPSRYEGFGLPVVEAYSRGKAVILSNGGALSELARDGGLDPDDDDVWSRQIDAWIADPKKIKQSAAGIEERIRNRGWSDVVADLLASVRSLV